MNNQPAFARAINGIAYPPLLRFQALIAYDIGFTLVE